MSPEKALQRYYSSRSLEIIKRISEPHSSAYIGSIIENHYKKDPYATLSQKPIAKLYSGIFNFCREFGPLYDGMRGAFNDFQEQHNVIVRKYHDVHRYLSDPTSAKILDEGSFALAVTLVEAAIRKAFGSPGIYQSALIGYGLLEHQFWSSVFGGELEKQGLEKGFSLEEIKNLREEEEEELMDHLHVATETLITRIWTN